jgi:hypothetical protein
MISLHKRREWMKKAAVGAARFGLRDYRSFRSR